MRLAWTFFALSVAALGVRYWIARPPADFEGCVAELVDGDADGAERTACLRVILENGLPLAAERGRVRPAVLAAVAAILLGDRSAFDAIVDSERAAPYLGGSAPLAAGPATADLVTADRLLELALGEARLVDFLAGHVALRRGDLVAAERHFARCRSSAVLTGDPRELTIELADDALGEVEAATRDR